MLISSFYGFISNSVSRKLLAEKNVVWIRWTGTMELTGLERWNGMEWNGGMIENLGLCHTAKLDWWGPSIKEDVLDLQ
jgi:hypothetical protein